MTDERIEALERDVRAAREEARQANEAAASLRGKIAANADELQGRRFSATAPTAGQVPAWNAVTKKWEPAALGAAGEANTGSDLGGTAGTFKQKAGVDLEFRGITGGAGITVTENATDIDVDADVPYWADTGAADAYVITPVPDPGAYAAGDIWWFKAANLNTGASTLNVHGEGAKNILKRHDVALAAGDIEANAIVLVVYDGTSFQMLSQLGTLAHGIAAHTEHGNWKLFYSDGSGDEQELALPADGSKLVGYGVAAAPQFEIDYETINFIIDGGGSVITTGIKGDVQVDFKGTIVAWSLLPDQSGSIVIDIWKQAYADFPPENANAMPGGGKEPTLTATTKAQDTAITDWTTDDFNAGDILRFNVDSITTCERVTLALKCKRLLDT